MQPKIIEKDKLFIAGLTGDGTKTYELWNVLDIKYNTNPFPKSDENGYEIRFFTNETKGKDIHVGFLGESEYTEGYDIIIIPPSEYAVFDVYVANGYESGNEEMDKWLEDNSMLVKCREINGSEFIIEYYNERFKDGDKPDSIVEFWIPFIRKCQSCFMEMDADDKFGTEADGSKNLDYCCYCYADGDFTTKQTLEEAVEGNIQFWREDGDTSDDQARDRIKEVFPKLKRWMK